MGDSLIIEILVIGSLLGLMVFTRIPLGFIMMFCGAAGIAAMHPRGVGAGLAVAEQQIMDLALNYNFSVLPLFILMGIFVVKAGLADEMFDAARAWLGHYRGGLGMATIVACGGFSAISTSSTAGAATMGHISIPAMIKAKYNTGLAAGAVAAGGTLLIPPSGALIVYGLVTEESITKLYIASLIPGLLQLAFYLVVMLLFAYIVPSWAPADTRVSWKERMRALSKVWGIAALFLLIMGGLMAGWFSPTEAGGIGAGGALIFALARRKLNWASFVDALADTAKISTMIFLVAAGAMVLNQFINISGISGDTVNFIQSLNLEPWQVILGLVVFYIVLGTLMDGYAMILLTVPVIVPVVQELGFDLIWWGVITVILVELSLISPPVGLNVFVLRSVLPNVPLSALWRGMYAFIAADTVRVLILIAFPALVLWLPSFTGGHG
ncbi:MULTISPECIES: TRAP transporter large permease [unclassified Devosia]|uniref:TRAP transporter large permease n=1 Tax=unclassified Devosia TaxID=196773 RepID=UPI00145E114B|nr:TRAP transporter large permease [Devosia sp. MC521]MBJ6987889.1 TRAP transporter large permease [Devosia sp. MC521]QMW63792.1 TRAP transporter large permease [Devosia sp. MC521]